MQWKFMPALWSMIIIFIVCWTFAVSKCDKKGTQTKIIQFIKPTEMYQWKRIDTSSSKTAYINRLSMSIKTSYYVLYWKITGTKNLSNWWWKNSLLVLFSFKLLLWVKTGKNTGKQSVKLYYAGVYILKIRSNMLTLIYKRQNRIFNRVSCICAIVGLSLT